LFSAKFLGAFGKSIPPAILKFCAAFVFIRCQIETGRLAAKLLLDALKLP
jgi:hypothetical protein